MRRTVEDDEPDVTPLINVNLMILVMSLAIAAHAARLLPLLFPKAEATQIVAATKSVPLTVLGPSRFRLEDRELDAAGLAAELAALGEGTIVTVNAAAGVKYAALVEAMDQVSAVPGLDVAFGDLTGGGAGAPAGTSAGGTTVEPTAGGGEGAGE